MPFPQPDKSQGSNALQMQQSGTTTEGRSCCSDGLLSDGRRRKDSELMRHHPQHGQRESSHQMQDQEQQEPKEAQAPRGTMMAGETFGREQILEVPRNPRTVSLSLPSHMRRRRPTAAENATLAAGGRETINVSDATGDSPAEAAQPSVNTVHATFKKNFSVAARSRPVGVAAGAAEDDVAAVVATADDAAANDAAPAGDGAAGDTAVFRGAVSAGGVTADAAAGNLAGNSAVGVARREEAHGFTRAVCGAEAEEDRSSLRARSPVLRKGAAAGAEGPKGEEREDRDFMRGRSRARGAGDGRGELAEKRRRFFSLPRRRSRVLHQAVEEENATRRVAEHAERRERTAGERCRRTEVSSAIGNGGSTAVAAGVTRAGGQGAPRRDADAALLATGKASCSAIVALTDGLKEAAGEVGLSGEAACERGGTSVKSSANKKEELASPQGGGQVGEAEKGRYLAVNLAQLAGATREERERGTLGEALHLVRSPRSLFVTGERSPREKPPSPPMHRSKHSNNSREDANAKASSSSSSSSSSIGINSRSCSRVLQPRQTLRAAVEAGPISNGGEEQGSVLSVIKENSTSGVSPGWESLLAVSGTAGDGRRDAGKEAGATAASVRRRGTTGKEQVLPFTSQKEAAALEKKLAERATKERRRRQRLRRRRRSAKRMATAEDEAGDRERNEAVAAAEGPDVVKAQGKEDVNDSEAPVREEHGESVVPPGEEVLERRHACRVSSENVSRSSSGEDMGNDTRESSDRETGSERGEAQTTRKSAFFEDVLREIEAKANAAAATYVKGAMRSNSLDGRSRTKRRLPQQRSSLTDNEECVSAPVAESDDTALFDEERRAAACSGFAAEWSAGKGDARVSRCIPAEITPTTLYSRRSTAHRLREGLLPRSAKVYEEAWKMERPEAARSHFLQRLETIGWMRRLTERDADEGGAEGREQSLTHTRSMWTMNESPVRGQIQVKQGTRIKGKARTRDWQPQIQQRKLEQEQQWQREQQQQEQDWVVNQIPASVQVPVQQDQAWLVTATHVSVVGGGLAAEKHEVGGEQLSEEEANFFSDGESSFLEEISRTQQELERQKQLKKYVTEKRGRSMGHAVSPLPKKEYATPVEAVPRRKKKEQRGHPIYPSAPKETFSRYFIDFSSLATAKNQRRRQARQRQGDGKKEHQLSPEDLWESSTPSETSAEDWEDVIASTGDVRASAATPRTGTKVAGVGVRERALPETAAGQHRSRKSAVKRVLSIRPYSVFSGFFDTSKKKPYRQTSGLPSDLGGREELQRGFPPKANEKNVLGPLAEEVPTQQVDNSRHADGRTTASDPQSIGDRGELGTTRDEDGKERTKGEGEAPVSVALGSGDHDASVNSQQNKPADPASSRTDPTSYADFANGGIEATQPGVGKKQVETEDGAAVCAAETGAASSGITIPLKKSSISPRRMSFLLSKSGLSFEHALATMGQADSFGMPEAISVSVCQPGVPTTATTTTAVSNATGTTACTASTRWRAWPVGSNSSREVHAQQRQHKKIHGRASTVHRRRGGSGHYVPDVPASCPIARALLDNLLLAQQNLVISQSEATQLTHAKIKRLLACQRVLQRHRMAAPGGISAARWIEMREKDERGDMAEEDFDAPLSSSARQQLLLHEFLQLVCMQVRLAQDIPNPRIPDTASVGEISAFCGDNLLALVQAWVHQEEKERRKKREEEQRAKLKKSATGTTTLWSGLSCHSLSLVGARSRREAANIRADVEKALLDNIAPADLQQRPAAARGGRGPADAEEATAEEIVGYEAEEEPGTLGRGTENTTSPAMIVEPAGRPGSSCGDVTAALTSDGETLRSAGRGRGIGGRGNTLLREQLRAHRNLLKDVGQIFSTFFLSHFRRNKSKVDGETACAGRKRKKKKREEEEQHMVWRRRLFFMEKSPQRETMSFDTTCASEGMPENDRETQEELLLLQQQRQRQLQRRAERLMRREFRRLIRMGINVLEITNSEQEEADLPAKAALADAPGGSGLTQEETPTTLEREEEAGGPSGNGPAQVQEEEKQETVEKQQHPTTYDMDITQSKEEETAVSEDARKRGGAEKGDQEGEEAAAATGFRRPLTRNMLRTAEELRRAGLVETSPALIRDVVRSLLLEGIDEDQERIREKTAAGTKEEEEREEKSELKNDLDEGKEQEEDRPAEVCPIDNEAVKGAREELAKLLQQQRLLLRKHANEAVQRQQQEQEGNEHYEENPRGALKEEGSNAVDEEGMTQVSEHQEETGCAAERENGVTSETHFPTPTGYLLTVNNEVLKAPPSTLALASEAVRDESATATVAADVEHGAAVFRSPSALGADAAAAPAGATMSAAAPAATGGDFLREKAVEELLAETQYDSQLQTSRRQSPASVKSWKETWTEMTRRGYAVVMGRTPPSGEGEEDEEALAGDKCDDGLFGGEWVYPPASKQQPLVMLQDCNFRFLQRRLEEHAKIQNTKKGFFSVLKKTLTLSPRARRRRKEEVLKNSTSLCSPYPKPIDLPPRFFFIGRPAAEVIFVTSTLGVRKHTFFRCTRLSNFLACRAIVYYQIDANIDSSLAATGGAADERLLRRWKRQKILRNAPHTHHRGVLVPQLLVDGQSVGSYEEVMKLEDDGLFDALVSRGRCPTCLQPRQVGFINCTACGSSFRELLSLRKQQEGQVTEMYRGRPTRSAPVFSTRVDENTSWELYSGHCSACGSRREIDDPFCPRCHLAIRDIAIAKVLGLGIRRSAVCTQCGNSAGGAQDCLEPLPGEANPFEGKPLGSGFFTSRASPLCNACGCLLTYLRPMNKYLEETCSSETVSGNGGEGRVVANRSKSGSNSDTPTVEAHPAEQQKNQTLDAVWQQQQQQHITMLPEGGNEIVKNAVVPQSAGEVDEDKEKRSDVTGTSGEREPDGREAAN